MGNLLRQNVLRAKEQPDNISQIFKKSMKHKRIKNRKFAI